MPPLHEALREREALVEDRMRGGDENDVPVVLGDVGQEAQERPLAVGLVGVELRERAADGRLEVVQGRPIVEAVGGRGQAHPFAARAPARLHAELLAHDEAPLAFLAGGAGLDRHRRRSLRRGRCGPGGRHGAGRGESRGRHHGEASRGGPRAGHGKSPG